MTDFLEDIADRVRNGTATPVEVLADLMTSHDGARAYEWGEAALRGAAAYALEELRKRGYDIVRVNVGTTTGDNNGK